MTDDRLQLVMLNLVQGHIKLSEGTALNRIKIGKGASENDGDEKRWWEIGKRH